MPKTKELHRHEFHTDSGTWEVVIYLQYVDLDDDKVIVYERVRTRFDNLTISDQIGPASKTLRRKRKT